MAQLQRINVMQGQIDTLSQQTASFASTEAEAAERRTLRKAPRAPNWPTLRSRSTA